MTASGSYKRFIPQAAGGALILAVVAGMLWFINHMLNADTPTGKKTAQQITLLKLPPPLPPPPKVEEPPPEPEVVEDKTPDPEPQESDQATDDVPAGEDLGLDAEGGAGGDAFGLVGKKGARDLIGGNSAGRLAWYNRILERDIQDQLAETPCTRARSYRAEWKLWLHADGKVQRIELSGSSGNPETDDCLRTASRSVRLISERPPDEARNPVKIKITSRS